MTIHMNLDEHDRCLVQMDAHPHKKMNTKSSALNSCIDSFIFNLSF